ncbi:MAG: excinuclease ABC subunit UvrC [Traorella sp.]
MVNEKIKQKLELLPLKPGCYMMKNKEGEIIYVGKAIKLKNRVHSYFVGSHNYKTTKLVSQIDDFETIVTSSEKEALLLEFNLIKQYRPRFNIMFMDDKSYPYLKLTKDKAPTLSVTRNIKDKKAEYFGPFPDSGAAYQTKDLINRLFPLRKCKTLPKKVCLYYHIHECLGYCEYKIDDAIQEEMIKKIRKFLKGDTSKIIQQLTSEMNEASEALNFEKAKEKHELILAIEHVTQQQKVQFKDQKNRDVFAYYEEYGYISIQNFILHDGKILNRDLAIQPLVEDAQTAFLSFVIQYYEKNIVPDEIILPNDIDCDGIEELLHVKVVQPKQGNKKQLVEMVKENAQKSLKEKIETLQREKDKKEEAMKELSSYLHKEIHTIEMIDNSHISGAYNCSGVVVFKDGEPSKGDYRLYRLDEYKSDMDSMKEVLYRRYYRKLLEKQPISDLLVVDGGYQQIEAAKEIIDALGIDIPIVGLVKDEKHRTNRLMNANLETIEIKKDSALFFFLTNLQDEVHRYAINYHRKLRSKALNKSILDDIEGIGEVRKKQIWKKYKTIKNLRKATFEELKEILPANVAENVVELIGQKSNDND